MVVSWSFWYLAVDAEISGSVNFGVGSMQTGLGSHRSHLICIWSFSLCCVLFFLPPGGSPATVVGGKVAEWSVGGITAFQKYLNRCQIKMEVLL